MKKLLSFCALVVGIGTIHAARLYIVFDYTVDNPIVTSMDVEKRFDRIAERPMHVNYQDYTSVTFRFVDDNFVDDNFVDDNSEASYTLTHYQANKLGLVDIDVFANTYSTKEHDSLDLAEPQYQYLNAESFGLIMRLLKEGVEAPTFEFSAKSVDSFLHKVVAEGNASNKLVLGCKTPLTLALKLAHIFSYVPLRSRLGDMCMALAVSNEYLRMDTPEDIEIINQMASLIAQHIDAAYNDFLIPCWTCIKTLTRHGDIVLSVAFSPDGNHIASGGCDKTVRIWDMSSGACIKTLEGHESWVRLVAFSPDGKHVASGSNDSAVRIWDVNSGACIKARDDGLVMSVAFSPDGKHVASGNLDYAVRIWDVSSGACIKTLKGHDGWVNSVAFSPDGKHVASGSYDNTVRIWDVSSGACIKTLTGHGNWVQSVAFSPDGKSLASGSYDRTVRIWDVSSGACIKTLTGHGALVVSVAFSPDGNHIASGGCDKTVRIWDVSSGACIKTLDGHDSAVNSVAFSPDGKHVASSSRDNTVRIWGLAGELSSLSVLEQWGMLVQNARSPFANRMEAQLFATVSKSVSITEQFIASARSKHHPQKIAVAGLVQSSLAQKLSEDIQSRNNPLADFVKRQKPSVFSVVVSTAKSWIGALKGCLTKAALNSSPLTPSVCGAKKMSDVPLWQLEERLDSLIEHGELMDANALFEKYGRQLKARSKRYADFARELEAFVCRSGAGPSKKT